MLIPIILFIIGLVLLIKGADFLVDGASDLAKDYGVSKWIIGVTIVAFGTSVPELTVGVIAALRNYSDITMGNVIGSNIANIGLILGLAAILLPIPIKERLIRKEMIVLLVSSILLLIFPLLIFPFNPSGIPILENYSIGRIKGIIFLLIFLGFIYFVIKKAKSERKTKQIKPESKIESKKSWKHLLLIMLGLGGTVYGAKLVVDSGVGLARHFGVGEAVIALTMIAIGTSLPELVTCVVAAFKKKVEVAIGNIVGSNIFNILLVVGTSALINPLTLSARLITDVAIMLLFSMGLLFVVAVGKKVSRFEGVLLLLAYLFYIAFLF